MRKRIISAFITIIILVLVLISSAFFLISNLQNNNAVRERLHANNLVIGAYLEANPEEQEKIFDSVPEGVRVTYIDTDGRVLYDSSGQEVMENHLQRVEIQEALLEGRGTDIRQSATLDVRMVYAAIRLADGRFIRSAVTAGTYSLGNEYVTYIVTAIFMVIFISMFITERLSSFLLAPIEELSFATDRIARGELSRRVSVKKDAELKRLSTNFNNMAERLESTFKESLDKQNRLEAILKSMSNGVIAFDNSNRIIMMNPFAKTIFGIQGDMISMSILEIEGLRPLLEIMESDEEESEIRIGKPVRKDLKVKKADILGERMNKVGTVIVVQDITDVRRLENMRSQFVANVSHELKTPLTSIKGFSETLKYVEDEATRIKFLDIINEESERLTRLINDILTLSSIEQNREIKVEAIDVVEETQRIYDILLPLAVSKNIELTLTAASTPILMADRDMYNQMIINLIENAIKYTEPNGKVKVRIETTGRMLTLTIKDTGIGIPTKHMSRIFERFYRVDKARDRAKGGTGLGLAIVKHIVLAFHGTIDVDSEVGRGTLFTIRLPLDIEKA